MVRRWYKSIKLPLKHKEKSHQIESTPNTISRDEQEQTKPYTFLDAFRCFMKSHVSLGSGANLGVRFLGLVFLVVSFFFDT